MSRPVFPIPAASDLAPRYMTRFACTADACEDSCCTGWRILLDRHAYERIKGDMIGNPQDWRMFLETVAVTEDDYEETESYARIRTQKGPGKVCAFLDPDRLCYLWKRFGESHLGNVCVMFPRVVGRIGPRRELSASLSCPEAARLCLLADDALALVPLAEAPPGRDVIGHHLDPQAAADPRERHFDALRALFWRFLADPALPVMDAIGLCWEVGRGLDALRPPAGAGSAAHDQGAFADRLRALESEDAGQRLTACRGTWRAQGRPSASQGDALLGALLHPAVAEQKKWPKDPLYTLVRAALPAALWDGPGGVPLPGLFDALCRNRRAWIRRHPRRCDRVMRHFALNHLFKVWFTASDSLDVYWTQLALWITIMEALLYAGLESPEAGVPPAESGPLLDARAVWTVQKFAKAVEHSGDRLSGMLVRLADAGLVPMPTCLILHES